MFPLTLIQLLVLIFFFSQWYFSIKFLFSGEWNLGTYIFNEWSRLLMGFPSGSVVKRLLANSGDSGDSGSIPGLGHSPAEGNGNPLQYSCLENFQRQGSLTSYSIGVTKESDLSDWAHTGFLWLHVLVQLWTQRCFSVYFLITF